MRTQVVLIGSLMLFGCAGKVDYVRPTTQPQPSSNVKVIDKPREAVWSSSVPLLGQQFFVINNMDKSSGFINVSYTGDPEKYIDCGRITSYVKNARGERNYDFPGSRASQSYEVMNSSGLFFIDRRMTLEGRVNVVFEEVSATQTRVTANTRYVVQRQRTVSDVSGNSRTFTDTISFGSGASAAFPKAPSDTQTAECVATGALEREILSSIK